MDPPVEADEGVVERVLGAAVEVHRFVGPGLLETVYEEALSHELVGAGLRVRRQVPVPVTFKGRRLGIGFRADLIVEEQLLVEFKSIRALETVHTRQVLTYLRFLRLKTGFLLNFGQYLMKSGIKRISQ